MFNQILLEVYCINLFVNKVAVVYSTLSFIAIAKVVTPHVLNLFNNISLLFLNLSVILCFNPYRKVYLPPCFYAQAYIGKWELLLNSVFFQLFDNPGDPAKGVPVALSATDLLMAVAVKLPPFWPENIETWFVQAESNSREWL